MLRFLTPLFGFIFIELCLRILFPVFETGIKSAYEFDKDVGVKLKSGYITKTTDYKQEFIANKYGTVNPNDNFNDYKKLIFAIGDSYTKGTGVPMDSSYPLQLDLDLNIDKKNKYNLNYGVVNLGISSLGGLQYIEMYKKYSQILGYPDIILYFGTNNDYRDDVLFKNGYKHSHLIQGNNKYGFLLKPLIFLSKLETGKRVKIILSNYKYRNYLRDPELLTNLVPSNIGGKNNDKCIPTAKTQIDNINFFLKEEKDKMISFVLTWEDDTSEKCSSYSWLKDWAKKNNVKFADWVSLYSPVSFNWENMPKYNDHSSGHYRSWVNNIISKSFKKKILEMN